MPDISGEGDPTVKPIYGPPAPTTTTSASSSGGSSSGGSRPSSGGSAPSGGGAPRAASSTKQAVTMTDLLWVFASRGIWPPSRKVAEDLLKRFSQDQAGLASYVAGNFHPGQLNATPSWVLDVLRPELGNQVNLLGVDTDIAKVLLQSASEGWSSSKTQARLEDTHWWQTHNDQVKKWIMTGDADKHVLLEQAASVVSDQLFKLYGDRPDMNSLIKDRGVQMLASGVWSQDEWMNAQRNTQQYKEEYAGNVARQAAGLRMLDESTYKSYEQQFRNEVNKYGQADYKPADFATLFAHDVDPSELGDRLKVLQAAFGKGVYGAFGAHTRQLFEQQLGHPVDESDLYHFFNGNRPDLEQTSKNAGGHVPPQDLYNLFSGKTTLAQLQDAYTSAAKESQAEFQMGGGLVRPQPGQLISEEQKRMGQFL